MKLFSEEKNHFKVILLSSPFRVISYQNVSSTTRNESCDKRFNGKLFSHLNLSTFKKIPSSLAKWKTNHLINLMWSLLIDEESVRMRNDISCNNTIKQLLFWFKKRLNGKFEYKLHAIWVQSVCVGWMVFFVLASLSIKPSAIVDVYC